jgi:hypothetical protein
MTIEKERRVAILKVIGTIVVLYILTAYVRVDKENKDFRRFAPVSTNQNTRNQRLCNF